MDKYSKTRFNTAPQITHSRTRFDLSHNHTTTFNTGDFVPVLCEMVFPSDTISLKTVSLTRLETSLHQTLDNAYLEFAFFYVPVKDLWSNFDKFMGANDDPWLQTTTYSWPQLYLDHGALNGSPASVLPGSTLNHLMLPANGSYGGAGSPYNNHNSSLHVDLLPLRGTFKVFNDWYRDENYDSIIYFDTGDSNNDANGAALGGGTTGTTGQQYGKYLFNGAVFNPSQQALKVNRLRDLFSTALPAPQKGQDTTISLSGLAPVITGSPHLLKLGNSPLIITDLSGNAISADDGLVTNNNGQLLGTTSGTAVTASGDAVTANQYADLGGLPLITVNAMRLAIVTQAMKERDARGGTRLPEKIASIFNIKVNSLEVGRSEFLGGKRIPLNMMEVLQTSETNTTVLGTDAGHSKTLDSSDSFIRSFTDYGYILGFAYIRTDRSYSQGIDRKFLINSIYDLLDPMLDNIGEVAVNKVELDAIHNPNMNDTWGYQEQYYWLKERTNRFSGYFQPGITGTLSSWHYGDNYASKPSLSASWLKEGPENVDRTIAVASSNTHQWSLQCHFELYATRSLKKYSIPNTFGF